VNGEADPLVSNGLASPTCKDALASELSPASRSNCESSGFIAAPAPTGGYGIDVHIDTGLLGFSAGGLQSTVQDLLITPLWMVLVWAVHALIVVVEWCFTIDLLDSAAAGGLARGLRAAQASFTQPWLVLALAVAAILAAYRGLVRRNVADTLGEVLVMAAMMLAGLWVIADPSGTVGALGEWSNEASLGTLAVAAAGTPSAPGRALGASLDMVFAAAIEGPWCYLEFGNVSWCREPARLDASLRRAALAIAAQEQAQAGCGSRSACAAAGSSAQALQRSARLLREARTNGAVFLALPANGPARNSINDEGSLLRTLCQSSEATHCHGATAAQAEFRGGGQTMARLGGLLLIAAGLLGMLLLMGFLALRLLAAAIFSLLYLLMAPAVVLAPAFGESGRALFRKWAAQLLGAVVSKLMFSFLLGAVLSVLSVLSALSAIGWWTQWLLMSALWWGAFARRHQALGVIAAGTGREQAAHRSVLRRVGDALETRKVNNAVRYVQGKRNRTAPEVAGRRDDAGGTTARRRADPRVAGQSERSLEVEYEHANASAKDQAESRPRISAMGARLGRVRSEQAKARSAGDHRRASSLAHRARRIEGEIEQRRGALEAARRIAKTTPGAHIRDNRDERERFLDAQAALPSGAQVLARGAERRDYRALAGLAGHAPHEYQRLGPREQREARLEIDRELALRNEMGQELRGVDRHTTPRSRPAPAGRPSGRAEGPRGISAREQLDPELVRAARESVVLRDARDVAAGRKRQLGRGRP
jgi:hypothetical protein